MKDKNALKLFIRDNISLFLIILLTQVIFFGFLFYIKGIRFEETVYFSFLVFFVLVLFFLVRFYKMGRVYGKLLLKSELLNDYLIDEPRSRLEENYNLMIEEMIENKNKTEIMQKQDKKLQKVMVYRFVHQMKTPVSVLKLILEKHNEEGEYKKIGRNINALE